MRFRPAQVRLGDIEGGALGDLTSDLCLECRRGSDEDTESRQQRIETNALLAAFADTAPATALSPAVGHAVGRLYVNHRPTEEANRRGAQALGTYVGDALPHLFNRSARPLRVLKDRFEHQAEQGVRELKDSAEDALLRVHQGGRIARLEAFFEGFLEVDKPVLYTVERRFVHGETSFLYLSLGLRSPRSPLMSKKWRSYTGRCHPPRASAGTHFEGMRPSDSVLSRIASFDTPSFV